MEELVTTALDEIALEGHQGALDVTSLLQVGCGCFSPVSCGAGCSMSRLCELLAECLPVAGITALTEPVKRGLWEALLHRPNDVTQLFGEKCEFLGLQPTFSFLQLTMHKAFYAAGWYWCHAFAKCKTR